MFSVSQFLELLLPTLKTNALDLLTADAQSIATPLQQGRLSSVELVEKYLDSIQLHDGRLHAMLSIAPREDLLRTVAALDLERTQRNVRGPLHGIPIIIKDNIATHPDLGMKTTCGSLALQDMRPYANTRVADKVKPAPFQQIAPSFSIPSGWSGLGGQCQSAYVRGGVDPDDTVGVSAGYAPFSLGSETDGSLVSPASTAALYTIKPTIGLVSQDGIISISHTMDSAGPMAKTPHDLAALLDIIWESASGDSAGPTKSFYDIVSSGGSWGELSIATLGYKKWWPPKEFLKPVESATNPMHSEIQAAYNEMERLAKRFAPNVPLPMPSEYMLDGRDTVADFRVDLDRYLQSTEYCRVRSIQELINFNIEHADNLQLGPGEYESHLSHLRKVAREDGIDHILEKYQVDVIVGSADTAMTALASGSGYPVGAVHLGYLDYNGRPFGLAVLAGRNQEAKIFKFMNVRESTFGPRRPPSL
ncbi:amidase signature domain-containing protein [Stachybotrys elegans]|uniref:Amidase signature domain-containing protein n=1 Tax=Stachybotrys elegans TaxID=80388 RepID=A0A8K0SNS6_9HYPO|nr:amidase signature domain-containing protein [Stachybotrys elegans]